MSCADTPKWLTQDFVENILKNFLKNVMLKVENIDISAATAKGDSYCSVMTRVKANYKESKSDNEIQTISFLVKSSYEGNPVLTKVLELYDAFNTEMQMYENVMPQLTQILQYHGYKEQLCAKTLYVDYKKNIIIIEDLSVLSYLTTNRLCGMDMAHVKLCLEKLAKFHAAAAVLNEKSAGSLVKYDHGIFNKHVQIYSNFFKKVITVCAEFAGNCQELGDYYKDKLLEMLKNFTDYVYECIEVNESDFMTLNHGDLWTNNVMIKYNAVDKRIPKDILLIDFQYSHWSSPALDLHYFFSTSLQNDLLFYNQDKFVKYYHSILVETLKTLGYKQQIPSLHEFQVQFLKRKFYGK